MIRPLHTIVSGQEVQAAFAVLDRFPDFPRVGMFVMRPVVETEALKVVFGDPTEQDERFFEAHETVDDLTRVIAGSIIGQDFPELGIDAVGLAEGSDFQTLVESAVCGGLRAAYLLMQESMAA